MWLVAAKSTNDITCKCPNTDQITLTPCKSPTLKQILYLLLVNINFFSEVTVNDSCFQKAAENLIFEGSVVYIHLNTYRSVIENLPAATVSYNVIGFLRPIVILNAFFNILISLMISCTPRKCQKISDRLTFSSVKTQHRRKRG